MIEKINKAVTEGNIPCGQVEQKSYRKGVTLYNQGEVCNSLTIVIEGDVVAYVLGENGAATNMFEFKKGHMIGANLLFGVHHDYPFNIYCASDCELLHIRKEAVEELLKDYTFVMEYVKYLSINSQGMNRKIKIFAQGTLRDHLIDYLKQQQEVQESTTILLPISKRELADYLGVQRPSLFRELKKLKEEQFIEMNNRYVKLLKDL